MKSRNSDGFGSLTLRELGAALKLSLGIYLAVVVFLGIPVALIEYGSEESGLNEAMRSLPGWGVGVLCLFAAVVFPQVTADALKGFGSALVELANLVRRSRLPSRIGYALLVAFVVLLFFISPLFGWAIAIYIAILAISIEQVLEKRKASSSASEVDADEGKDDDV